MVLFLDLPGAHEWKVTGFIIGDSKNYSYSIESPSMGTGQIKVADGPKKAFYSANASLSIRNSMGRWESVVSSTTTCTFEEGESGYKSITVSSASGGI